MHDYIITSNGELYHYGIKGQKWGVRRYKNKDGTLTDAGKKRNETKSKHRMKLEEAYQKAGLSKAEAEKAADKRIQTEKILIASAAIAVTACAAYVANKELKKRIDGVIKVGESMQRIEYQDTGGKLHDVFYVSKGKHDNTRYYNMLGSTRQWQTGKAFVMKLEANDDIKVASRHNAEKVFKELYNSDMEFRLRVTEQANMHFTGKNRVDPNRLLTGKRSKELTKLYENFNSNLIGIREKGSGVDKKFYNALKKKGYGAIQDINDMKFSGYNAKNPLIVFDNSNKNIMVKSMTRIEKDLSRAGQREFSKAVLEQKVSETLKRHGLIGTGVLTATAASAYTSDPSKDIAAIKKG